MQNHLHPFPQALSELADFLQKKSPSKVLILVDENTAAHCSPLLLQHLPQLHDALVYRIASGENEKNLSTCEKLWQYMNAQQLDRAALLINLGGGVLSDIGGFAAACYKRGIAFVNVPSTLLAMVDAAIGGKTGINLNYVKNVIGSFAMPQAVFIYPPFLQTLAVAQMQSAYAEMLKHALIANKALWHVLKTELQTNEEFIFKSIEIKYKIASADPQEKGLRKILNFGHSIGHALESYSLMHDKFPLRHGEAVAAGMICESYISAELGAISEAELADICLHLFKLFPKYQFEEKAVSELIELMAYDKKNQQSTIYMALLDGIGNAKPSVAIKDLDLVKKAFLFYLQK